jgi:hypothetical protein
VRICLAQPSGGTFVQRSSGISLDPHIASHIVAYITPGNMEGDLFGRIVEPLRGKTQQ